jgi:hypothetical protein
MMAVPTFSALDNGGHEYIAAARIGVPERRAWRERLLTWPWRPWHNWKQQTTILRCHGEIRVQFNTTHRGR